VELFNQAGAIPFRWAKCSLEVLLISTSSGKNMTIPKGLIDPGFNAIDTVLNEAFEEAGIKGRILTPAIGSFEFYKWGGRCIVEVFGMMVTHTFEDWPEGFMRQRVWTEYKQAVRRVKHVALGELILKLSERLGNSPC
jgi:phosphohistidine phosphatase